MPHEVVAAMPFSSRQVAHPLGSTPSPMGYHEYLPPGYGDGGPPAPLLVFLHGVAENGDGRRELDRVLRHGPPRLIAEGRWPAERPFVVLSPQNPGRGCFTAARVRDFLRFAVERYELDHRCLYLTGLSCGAIGAWDYLGEEGGALIAAAVLVCGHGVRAWLRGRCRLGEVPIWAFHGEADESVEVRGSIAPIEHLRRECPDHAELRLTLYPGVGHDAWTRTYDLSAGHDIYAWLLAQRRRP